VETFATWKRDTTKIARKKERKKERKKASEREKDRQTDRQAGTGRHRHRQRVGVTLKRGDEQHSLEALATKVMVMARVRMHEGIVREALSQRGAGGL
jgi:hypothetical protein